MADTTKKSRLTWYFVWAFAPAWILQLAASLCKIKNIGGETTSQLLFVAILTVCMFMPLVATVVSAKMTGEKTGIKIRPNFKGHIRWYVAAWFLPSVFFAVGATLYFVVCRNNFDPELTMLKQSLAAAAAAGQNVEGMTPVTMLLVTVVQAITYAPLLNGVAALGEEAGWRGYMTPALVEKLGRTKGLLLSGIIWGVWHWPVIGLVGYDFGTGYPLYPIPGFLAMCFACTALGIVLSFAYEKSGSIWVPSIAHGAVNAIANVGVVFLMPGVTSFVLGPQLGFISIMPFAIVAGIVLCKRETGKAEAKD